MNTECDFMWSEPSQAPGMDNMLDSFSESVRYCCERGKQRGGFPEMNKADPNCVGAEGCKVLC